MVGYGWVSSNSVAIGASRPASLLQAGGGSTDDSADRRGLTAETGGMASVAARPNRRSPLTCGILRLSTGRQLCSPCLGHEAMMRALDNHTGCLGQPGDLAAQAVLGNGETLGVRPPYLQ